MSKKSFLKQALETLRDKEEEIDTDELSKAVAQLLEEELAPEKADTLEGMIESAKRQEYDTLKSDVDEIKKKIYG